MKTPLREGFGRLLQMVSLLLVLLAAAASPAQAQTATWQSAIRSADTAYFLFTDHVERFDLATGAWLARVNLPRTGATAMATESTDVIVAYGQAVYHYNSDFTGETFVRNTNNPVRAIHIDGDKVILNHSVYLYSHFDCVEMGTWLLLGQNSTYIDSCFGSASAPGINKIFGRTSGISPSDIVMATYSETGAFTSVDDSPYHGTYANGNRCYVFPGEAKVCDDGGIVYSTADLTYMGSFGGRVDDVDWHGSDVPIVLRGTSLLAFSNTLLEAGSVSLTGVGTPSKVWVAGSDAWVFYSTTTTRKVEAEVHALTELNTPDPGQPISPVGLAFTPSSVFLDAAGTLNLVSPSNLTIFRWSTTTQEWLDGIPLTFAPSYVAYSPENNTIYLASQQSIYQIALSSGTSITPLANLPAAVTGLSAAGQYLFVCDGSGTWKSHTLFAANGTQSARRDLTYYSAEFIWSPANRRMFFLRDGISPNDLHYEEVLENGTFGTSGETPYHSSTGIAHPIRVSPDGAKVVLGSGRIYDGSGGLTQLGNLSNTFSDASWQATQLVTIRDSGGMTQVQIWNPTTYGQSQTFTLTGAPHAIRACSADQYAVVSLRNGRPIIRIFNATAQRVAPPGGFAPPSATQFSIVQGSVQLQWSDGDDEIAYRIERSESGSGNWVLLTTAPANTESFTDTTLTPGGIYDYRIVADYGAGVESLPATLHVDYSVPPAPSAVTATLTPNRQVSLNWTDGFLETSYRVERRTLPDGTYAEIGSVAADQTSWMDPSPVPGLVNRYRIVARGDTGDSLPSAEVNVTVPGLDLIAIYRVVRSSSGSAKGAILPDDAGVAPYSKRLTGRSFSYIVVDITHQTAVELTYRSFIHPTTKVRTKTWSSAPFAATWYVTPQGTNKWLFSAMDSDSGITDANEAGQWATMSYFSGLATPYTLKGIVYPALPASLSGRERLVINGNDVDAASTEFREFSVLDTTVTASRDTSLTTSSMTGPTLDQSGQLIFSRTLEYGVEVVKAYLTRAGYAEAAP